MFHFTGFAQKVFAWVESERTAVNKAGLLQKPLKLIHNGYLPSPVVLSVTEYSVILNLQVVLWTNEPSTYTLRNGNEMSIW